MIFLDTNVISETMRKEPSLNVMDWLARHDESIAIPTISIAEIAFGIEKIRPEQRSDLLAGGLDQWRRRFSDRIFPFTEEAAMIYGELMGDAYQKGIAISAPDGMIAAIVMANRAQLATRNTADFSQLSLDVIDPWQNI